MRRSKKTEIVHLSERLQSYPPDKIRSPQSVRSIRSPAVPCDPRLAAPKSDRGRTRNRISGTRPRGLSPPSSKTESIDGYPYEPDRTRHGSGDFGKRLRLPQYL